MSNLKRIPFKIIGGYAIGAKTTGAQQHTTIDLEALANHKGSAFGAMGPQAYTGNVRKPVGDALGQQQTINNKPQTIWLEDESQRIGNLQIPFLYGIPCAKARIFLDIPF